MKHNTSRLKNYVQHLELTHEVLDKYDKKDTKSIIYIEHMELEINHEVERKCGTLLAISSSLLALIVFTLAIVPAFVFVVAAIVLVVKQLSPVIVLVVKQLSPAIDEPPAPKLPVVLEMMRLS